MRTVTLLACALALVVAACDENPFNPSDLKEVTWKLESIERAGSPTVTVPNPDQYTLILKNDGHINVKADCNQCTGTYTLDGSSLKVSNLACTLVACPAGSLGGPYASQ